MLTLASPLLGFGALATAQESFADEARRALESSAAVRYEATYRRALALADTSWSAEGSVAWWSEPDGQRVTWIDARVTAPGSAEPVRLELRGSGPAWTLIDWSARSWSRADAPRALGELGDVATRLSLASFAADPFAACAADASEVSFDGGRCRVLRCGEAPGPTRTWHVSTADLLPRLGELRTPLAEGESLVERLVVREVTVHPDVVPPDAPVGLASIPSDFREVAPEPAPVFPGLGGGPGEGDGPTLTRLDDSLDPLIEHFNQSRGRPRLVGVFSPS